MVFSPLVHLLSILIGLDFRHWKTPSGSEGEDIVQTGASGRKPRQGLTFVFHFLTYICKSIQLRPLVLMFCIYCFF